MVVDEHMSESEQERHWNEGNSEILNPVPVPTEVVRMVAAGLKSLYTVLPYEEYASVVYRIARIRWRCQLAASHAQQLNDNM